MNKVILAIISPAFLAVGLSFTLALLFVSPPVQASFVCKGGADDGLVCANDTQCDDACVGGGFHGTACFDDAICVPGGTCTNIGICTAAKITLSGFVPNVGSRASGEPPVGDRYVFNCSAGDTITFSLDTKDDMDEGTSTLNPVVEIWDGDGSLVGIFNDNTACTYQPTPCTASCPQAVGVPCSSSNPHSLVIRDSGADGCTGGGYEMEFEIFNAGGNPVIPRMLNVTGGQSPSSNDENVPDSNGVVTTTPR